MGRKNLHEAFQQIEAQKRALREKEEQAELEARLRADREAEQRADEERQAREAEAAAQPPPDTDVAPLGGLAPSAAPAAEEKGTAPAPAAARPPEPPARPPGGEAAAGAGAPGLNLTAAVTQPVVLALFLLVFALGFFSGRLSTPAVNAGGPAGGGAPATSSSDSGGESGSGSSAGTRAPGPGGAAPAIPVAGGGDDAVQSDPVLARLFDPELRFTIQLISYNDSDYTRRLSEELVTYLRAQDFQASPPLKVGDNLTVLVGAEPTQEGLASTLAALRRTPGPNGEAGAFADARVRGIDDLLGRE